MTTNLIVSVVVGYQYKQIKNFVESISQNTSSQLLLLASGLDDDSIRKLNRLRCVNLQLFNYDKPVKSIGTQRFFMISDVLSKIRFDNALLADARDVFFQSDPFANVQSSLVFYKEPISISNCKINSGWIERDYGKDVLDRISHHSVLCCGTILGQKSELQKFLSIYCDLMSSRLQELKTLSWAFDQSSLNKLAYDQRATLDFITKGNEDGEVATLHHETRFFINRYGYLVNSVGSIIPVVHQYDRFPWLEKHFENSLS